MKKKVLIIATSAQTRGGISSVILAHKQTKYWNHWNCHWIATHVDRSVIKKYFYFVTAVIEFLFRIPLAKMIHVHLSEPTSAWRKYIFIKIALVLGKPVIVHFHAFSPENTLKGKSKNLYENIFKNVNKVVVLSNQWKLWLLENIDIDKKKIIIIPNPCPNVSFDKENRSNKILFAGTLNKRKGFLDLIRAFGEIAHRFPDWKLIFAGNGEIEEGKRMAKKLRILDQVVFLGWISGEEKTHNFRTSSIFCLPSYAEGFPMAVLDAFAFGLPIITTPVGGIPDVAMPNENMLIFEPGNIKELASRLAELISDKDFRERLTEASLELSRNNFSLRLINNKLNTLYYETYLG